MKNKILVIGEKCDDVFQYGLCDRLCPEAPVPVFRPSYEKINEGMAANVVCNLQSLAPHIEIVSVHQIQEITKTRIVDEVSDHLIVRIDNEPLIIPSLSESYLDNVDFNQFDAVVISDYDKGFLSQEIIKSILARAKAVDIPSFLDTKKILAKDWCQDLFCLKINKKESERQPEGFAEFCENVIVTMGKDGSICYTKGFKPHRTTVEEVEVRELSGAGDTFLAALVIGFLYTNNLLKASDFANEAARLAVSKRGVVAVKFEDVNSSI